ncbi:MAG: gamma-butyrobetaine hydroxylase-like domain-containing protein [Rhodoblastus sp.]
MTEAWPSEIRLHDNGTRLTIQFDDASVYDYSAEFLRVESPSAEVQGHAAAERKTVGGKKNVRISEIAPVGNYAIRLEFDDGHDTGIFSWKYLAELGRDQEAIWARYVAALAQKGLAR